MPGHTYRWTVNGLEKDDMDVSVSNLLASLTSEFEVKIGDASTLPSSTCDSDFERRWAQRTYVDHRDGFCFAYPADFGTQVNAAGHPVVFGPPLDSSLDPLRASMLIEVEVAVQGKTLAEIVDGYLAQFAGMDVPVISRAPFELGGLPAEILEVVPGREGSRDLFMLRDGTLFHLMFLPSVHDLPQVKESLEVLFDTVVNSFGLIPSNTAGQ
jgi:hypothetical protein